MVKLYIDSAEVDLFPDMRVNLNLSLFEIQDFTKRKVFKTGKFNIPLTNNNKALFGFPDCMNTDAPGQLEATMIQDGLNFTGIIEIYEVQNKGGMKSLSIQLVQSDWIKQIEGKKLSDLTMEGHEVSLINIITPWENEVNKNYIYPICDYGTFEGETFAFRDENEVQTVDVLPAVKIRNIVDAIFNEIGYKLTINSFFVNNWKYFLLSSENAYINDKDFVDDRLFYATPDGTQTISNTTETTILFEDITSDNNFGTGNYDEDTGVYTVDKAGSYRFIAYVRFTWTGATALVDNVVGVRLRKNGVSGNIIAFKSETYTTISGSGEIGIESDFIHLEVRDTVQATFSQTQTPTMTIGSAESYFYNDLDRRRALGYTYDNLSEILPDIEQKTFLQTLKTLFNLYFYLNPYTREILMVQRDRFHNDTARDWSDKLDTSGDITITFPNAPKQIRYGYADDSKDAIKQLEGGNYTDVNLNDDSLQTDDVSVSTVADTYLGKSRRIGIENNDIPIIWKEYDSTLGYLDSPDPDFTWKPRILFYEGKGSDSFVFNGNNRSSLDIFSRLTPEQIAGFYTNFNKNLLNSKLITAKFRLNPVEIDNMIVRQQGGDFRTPIYLDRDGISGYYYLVSIKNYDGKFATATLQKVNDKNMIGISDALTNERAGLEFQFTLPIEF